MKLLLVKPVIKLGEAKFPEDGTGERKYIYRLHLLHFYIYLTYFNKKYCATDKKYAIPPAFSAGRYTIRRSPLRSQ